MAKRIKRNYKKPDSQLLQQAGVIRALLYGTDGTDGDLATFTAELPDIDSTWLASFTAAINDADDAPGDDEVKTNLKLTTRDVVKMMELSRKRMVRLYRYATLAYPDDKQARDKFGYKLFKKARFSQPKMQEALRVAYTTAATEPERSRLITAGYTAAYITELNTLADELNTFNQTQETTKISRLEAAMQRIVKHNKVWDFIKNINRAAKVVFIENAAKRKQYRLNPEHKKKKDE
ncbi:MAG: hypothetical protein AB7G44_11180 [Bacteroidia bacterium]